MPHAFGKGHQWSDALGVIVDHLLVEVIARRAIPIASIKTPKAGDADDFRQSGDASCIRNEAIRNQAGRRATTGPGDFFSVSEPKHAARRSVR